MSTSVDILIWTPPERERDAYVDLVERMLVGAADIHLHVFVQYVDEDETFHDVAPTRDVLGKLANSSIYEQGRLAVAMGYRLPRGDFVPLEISTSPMELSPLGYSKVGTCN